MAGMGGGGGESGSGGGMKDNDKAMMGMMKQMMGKMDQMMGMGGGGGAPPMQPAAGVAAPGGTPMMDDDKDEMGMGGGAAAPMPPAGGAPAAAPMMDGDMDMMGMGGASMPTQPGGMANMPMLDKMQAKGMSRMGVGMNTGSASCGLAGFPGASHIYHIGATGFFLDHAMHITLTVELERKIEQAEQDLMEQTCSESPDAGKVEYKAREIGQLQAEQRVAFIRDVGRAASVLTDEQRQQLTGMVAPNPAPQPAGGGMSDM